MSPVLAQDQTDSLDSQAPLLQRVDVTGSVNAQSNNQYVTTTITLTDDISGVASYSVDFRSPSGMHHVARVKTIAVPRTKVKSEITLGASPFSEPPFLKFAEPGTWKVYSLTTTDAAGNTRSYDESQLGSLPGVHTFQVTNGGGYDIVPPTLASGTIQTPTVRLSKEPKGTPVGTPPFVSAQVSMTDAGNGVVSGNYIGRLMFCAAGSGSCQPGATNTFTMSGVSNRTGLAANSLAVGTQLVTNQMLGNYLIHSLEMVDVAGSHRTLLSTDFGGATNFHTLFPQGVTVFVSQ
ncbi:MAG: hypothetical protein U1F53_02480 [Burkholderiaceae bacterium]